MTVEQQLLPMISETHRVHQRTEERHTTEPSKVEAKETSSHHTKHTGSWMTELRSVEEGKAQTEVLCDQTT